MVTLNVKILVRGLPLRRTYVEQLDNGIGLPQLLMTDDLGRVCNENGVPGIQSSTPAARIRVHCQNSVIKVLDGETLPVPFGVQQDRTVTNGTLINFASTAQQVTHYEILNRALVAYDVVFRQFQVFGGLAAPDFPLGRGPSLRATRDDRRRIEASFPSQFPLGNLAFTEPASLATTFPLIHFRRNLDRVLGINGQRATQIAGELAHALHFAGFTNRAAIATDYVGWMSNDINTGGDGTHAIGKSTSPTVAYLEAVDHFAGRFSEYVRVVEQNGSGQLLQQQMTPEIRQAFVAQELTGGPVSGPTMGPAVGTLNSQGQIVPNAVLTGPNDEGSVYGCIFLDFARRVGMRTAVNAYFRSARDGVTTFNGYHAFIASTRPQHLPALDMARQTWGI